MTAPDSLSFNLLLYADPSLSLMRPMNVVYELRELDRLVSRGAISCVQEEDEWRELTVLIPGLLLFGLTKLSVPRSTASRSPTS